MNTKKKWCIVCVVMSFSVVVSSQTPLSASAIEMDQAITTVADRLETAQMKNGENTGAWLDNIEFTGAITVGMVDAYNRMGESSYWSCAELAGQYILSISDGHLYSDEALALTRLSDSMTDPLDNPWRTEVSRFYADIKDSSIGTQGYIDFYDELEPSAVVLCLAEHTVAAFTVGAEDIEIWRRGLIDTLSQINGNCSFPVLALGSATWALAQTGPLDQTLIDPFADKTSYWKSKKLEDLPGLLLSHQVPADQPMAGSFYWRLDHSDGGLGVAVSGYTEDTIYATLGLIAAYQTALGPREDVESAIIAARTTLLDGVCPQGWVREHLSQEGIACCVYAGEMLQVLCELGYLSENDPDIASSK